MGYWVGLDVGTTFSAAAVASDGRVEVVGLGHHAAAVPSVLFLKEDGSFLVGEAALRRGLSEPARLARYFKRRFGDSTPILLGGSPWSADALVSQMLRFLVTEVAAQEGGPPEGVAVTHPANWGPFKTDLLTQAVRAAGIQSAVLLSEPEAAALQYAWRERVERGQVVGIYDLGGGTFDAAVLAHSGSGFELRGQAEGIERLGGMDFDEAVFGHVSGFLGSALSNLDPNDPATMSALARLRADCVEAKEALSSDTDVSIPVMLPQVQTEIRLTRVEFEAMIRPTLAETTAALGRALQSAGVAPEAVKAVLLVGGSSRIPLVGQLVAGEIGRPVAVDVHPKHAVALGAALAAAGWNGVPGSARIAAPAGSGGVPSREQEAPAPVGWGPAATTAAGVAAGEVAGASATGTASERDGAVAAGPAAGPRAPDSPSGFPVAGSGAQPGDQSGDWGGPGVMAPVRGGPGAAGSAVDGPAASASAGTIAAAPGAGGAAGGATGAPTVGQPTGRGGGERRPATYRTGFPSPGGPRSTGPAPGPGAGPPPAGVGPAPGGGPAAGPARRADGTGGRRRLLVAALVIVAVAAAVGVGLVLTRGSGHTNTPAATTATTVAATTPTSIITAGSIAVPANQSWTDTNVNLDFGQHVVITATGTVSHNTSDPTAQADPDGDPRLDLRQFNILVDGSPMVANHSALIGKIGNGTPFVVGKSHSFDADAQGHLFLGINDAGVGNNSGSWQVSITVTTS